MQKEKVMTVTLMRSDLYDAPGYIGAYLFLPASRDEIQDAMDRARIRSGQPYQIVECFNMQDEELSFLPDKPSLDELNFLAHRISELSKHDLLAFNGCVMMGDERPVMQTLINPTYSLDGVHVVPVSNDKELEKFYVDNDFIDAVNHVPPAPSGDVAGAVEGTWKTASQQIKTAVNNVVFPINLILAVFFFAKLGTAYFDYRKHGQFE